MTVTGAKNYQIDTDTINKICCYECIPKQGQGQMSKILPTSTLLFLI